MSKPGIYYHVRDKEELLFRICESTMTALLSAARGATAAADDPLTRLRGVIRAHGAHYWAHGQEHVILFGQMRYLSPAARRIVVGLEREYLDLVRGIIRDGQRQRLFRRIDATVAAFSLFALLNTIASWYDLDGRLGPEAIVAEIEALYLSGLARWGPSRRPAARRGRSTRSSARGGKEGTRWRHG